MGIKEFLKPTIWKIVLTIIFIIVSLLSVQIPDCPVDFCAHYRGFPVPYLVVNIVDGVINNFSISYFGFLIDLIFWYLISCLIIFIHNKVRKNKNKRKR